uniref:Uncharacterized protein n=1 Tax=Opuntia streptacantha TaxID=393608 RepID=A0A7C9EJF6_OPUST
MERPRPRTSTWLACRCPWSNDNTTRTRPWMFTNTRSVCPRSKISSRSSPASLKRLSLLMTLYAISRISRAPQSSNSVFKLFSLSLIGVEAIILRSLGEISLLASRLLVSVSLRT